MPNHSSLPLVHIIADYGYGDLAFAEVRQRFKHLLPEVEVYTSSAPSFSTLNTGFLISQLSLYNPSKRLFIYSNTAPRHDDTNKRDQNEGEPFVYAELNNGVRICAVHAGWCFSFVKPEIKVFRALNVPTKGSQFRSRDFWPQAATEIIAGDATGLLGPNLPKSSIISVPKNLLMHIDSYGNLKTTIRKSDVKFKSGQKLAITINQRTLTGWYANGNFAVKSGDLAFAPGSSGGEKDPFMEIFLRSGSAFLAFAKPKVETKIAIKSLPATR